MDLNNLSTQIKNLRTAKGLTQEQLAERIYVSRQSISNWETGKNYPDIHSLLLLSTLFDVSLDTLVKGDLDMMRRTVDAQKMNGWAWVMLVTMVLAAVLAIPSYKILGPWGLLIPLVLWGAGMGAAIAIDRLKKRNDVQTYAEILAFLRNEPLDTQKATTQRRRLLGTRVAWAMGSAVLSGILIGVGYLLYRVFAG